MTTVLRSLNTTQRLVLSAMALAGVSMAIPSNGNGNGNGNNNGGNFNFSDKAKKALLGFGATTQFDKEALSNTREASLKVKDYEYYQKIYNDIAQKIVDEDDHDDGSFGPLLVRLAWHNSGSYNQHDQTKTKGGSFAGTMRFEKEQKDPENAGLTLGMKFLDPFLQKYPDLSHGDLYTLGGVVAIQEMQGPKIPWRPGRVDLESDVTPPYHRLPDASQETGEYVRSVFQDRLGFTDKDLVVLIGVGHGIGRCHTYNSGFDGPWTFSPTMVTNEFFKLLLSEDWKERKWGGKRQYEDEGTHSLMMLPSDMVLKKDSNFRKYVEEYAKDQDKCFKDFSIAFSKLLERGVDFGSRKPFVFKSLDEQE